MTLKDEANKIINDERYTKENQSIANTYLKVIGNDKYRPRISRRLLSEKFKSDNKSIRNMISVIFKRLDEMKMK